MLDGFVYITGFEDGSWPIAPPHDEAMTRTKT